MRRGRLAMRGRFPAQALLRRRLRIMARIRPKPKMLVTPVTPATLSRAAAGRGIAGHETT
jgi:hypothetical protein